MVLYCFLTFKLVVGNENILAKTYIVLYRVHCSAHVCLDFISAREWRLCDYHSVCISVWSLPCLWPTKEWRDMKFVVHIHTVKTRKTGNFGDLSVLSCATCILSFSFSSEGTSWPVRYENAIFAWCFQAEETYWWPHSLFPSITSQTLLFGHLCYTLSAM